MDAGYSSTPQDYDIQHNPPYRRDDDFGWVNVPYSWTDSISSYIKVASKHYQCVMRNLEKRGESFTHAVSIIPQVRLTIKEAKRYRDQLCRRLRLAGIVALLVVEASPQGVIHWHGALLSHRDNKANEVKSIIRSCLPDDIVTNIWAKRLATDLDGERWLGYMFKCKVDRRDRFRAKRVLFIPHCGMNKTRVIGKFWSVDKPMETLWLEIQRERNAIKHEEGIRAEERAVKEFEKKVLPIVKKVSSSVTHQEALWDEFTKEIVEAALRWNYLTESEYGLVATHKGLERLAFFSSS